MQSKRVGLGMAAILASTGLVVTAGAAWASPTNCGHYKQDHPTDSSARVVAYSTHVHVNEKVRGELVRSAFLPNKFTQWFTDDSGRAYYSDYASNAVDTACEVANV